MNRSLLSILFGAVATLAACLPEEFEPVENIDMGGEMPDIALSIHGFVSSEEAYHWVEITEPIQRDDKVERKPVLDATVAVASGTNIYVYVPIQHHPHRDTIAKYGLHVPGYYYSLEPFRGEVGHVYTLTVQRQGSSYSASDTLVAARRFRFAEVGFPVQDENDRSGTGISPLMYKHHFGFDQPYGFSLEISPPGAAPAWVVAQGIQVYGHPGSPPQGVYAGWETASGSSLPLDWQFSLRTYSITEGHYAFLRSLFNETDWKQGFFSTYPGNPPTNFSTGATGYFFATDIQVDSLDGFALYELMKGR